MKILRCLLLAPVLLFVAPLAQAQLSVYGTIGFSDYGYIFPGTGNLEIYNDSPGLTGGLAYMVPTRRRFKAGADLRVEYSPGSRGGVTGIAALRLAFVPRSHRLSPYFQLGGGVVSDTGREVIYEPGINGGDVEQQRTITSGDVGIAAGLDFRLGDSFDYRIIELQEAVSGRSSSSADMACFSTGIVYHLPHRH